MAWTRIGTTASFTALILATAVSAVLAGGRNDDPAAATTAQAQAVAESATTPINTEPVLPEGCDPLYRYTSPDSRRVAFVGDYTPTILDAKTRHGLFVVNLATKEVRQLIDNDLKSTTAWSPDSRKLAIGDSPGYGNIYPLAIVDADTGMVDRTGVQGAGPAWSPDGRFIAVSTGFHQGGSWSGGIPVDGRLGLYDTQTRRLTSLTPPGYNHYDDRTGLSAMRGAIRPVWSPDGRRVAFELWTQTRQGEKTTEVRDVWVVDRDGKNLRRALAGSTVETHWSPDGKALTIEKSSKWPGGRVEVDGLPAQGPEALPQPPAEILAALRAAAEAKRRAGTFDVAPVLTANRAWQQPALNHLQSVQFVHKMQPIRLDERFVWRRDGAMLLDVVYYGREQPQEHVGSAWVVTPGGPIHSFAPSSHYPQGESKTAEQLNAYTLDHLMGTRVRFIALDWGRNPSAFDIRDIRRAVDGKTVTLELAPLWSRERRRVGINAGAMFETTSWAYVHDLYVAFAELTVETATHRIVHEVDHGFNGDILCEIDLSEWLEVGDGRSVPQRLRFRFPGQQFTVEDRFEWRPERLWILKSGESRFDGKEPERETIADLAINAPVPALEAALERTSKGVAALEAPAAIKPEKRSLVTGPFTLGVKIPLAGDRLESLAFTFHRDLKEARDPLRHWDHPTLQARLSPPPAGHEAAAGDALLMILYDDQGRPVGSAHAALPAGRAPVRLDLGSFKSLGSAKTWSLTILSKDGPHPAVPAAYSPQTVAEAFPVRPGESQVVQVDAVPDWRSPRDSAKEPIVAPTRLRSIHFGDHGQGALNASLELVSRHHWKDLVAKVTLVLLDDKDVPIGVGSLEHGYRVKSDIYDAAKLTIPLQGRTARAGAARVVAGVQTVTVGGPVGSTWGMFMDATSPYPIESLLAGDDPEVWRRGLAVLDNEIGKPLTHRRAFVHDSDDPTIDEETWGAIHRIIRHHGDRLATLFPKAEEAGPRELARLCRLAGWSGDERLVGPLKSRLDHPDDVVRDAAATGLGLLGKSNGRARLEAIIARPDPADAVNKSEADQRKAEARLALKVLRR
jgi:Tol biopolymer transport system component